jgi:hypothetical protein
VVRSSETSVLTRTIRCHISEDDILHSQRQILQEKKINFLLDTDGIFRSIFTGTIRASTNPVPLGTCKAINCRRRRYIVSSRTVSAGYIFAFFRRVVSCHVVIRTLSRFTSATKQLSTLEGTFC